MTLAQKFILYELAVENKHTFWHLEMLIDTRNIPRFLVSFYMGLRVPSFVRLSTAPSLPRSGLILLAKVYTI